MSGTVGLSGKAKMQYPVALFQKKKIKNPEFWDKVFIYYLCWVPVPRGIYSQTICKLKKELHSLSILLRTKQRSAVVGAGHTGSFPLSYTFPPYHPRVLATAPGSSARPQAMGLILQCPGLHSGWTEAAMGTCALCCCFQQH